MTERPPRYTAELADRILQGLAQGRTQVDICAEPEMPSDRTVRQWVADDIEGFAARYSQARQAGEPLVCYPTRYTPELAERIVGAVTSGRTLVEMCSEPGMPNVKTIRNWVAANREDFSQRYRQAQEIGRALSGGPIPYSADIADRVLGELMEGRTLVEVCDLPGMPSKGAVLLWARRDKDGFGARYREAREIGSQIMVDELITIGDNKRQSPTGPPGEGGEAAPAADNEDIDRSRLRCENRRWILSKAMPRIYGERIEITTKHDATDGWAELLKSVNGTTLRLPSEDEPTDES